MEISIVIANYNRGHLIDRAIRSCISQIIFRAQYEIIVVDDGSSDDSTKKIKEFGDQIKLISNCENLGVAVSSNIGLSCSAGKYWMRVDSDDFLNQFACATMKSILDNNQDIDFVYCDHIRVDELGLRQEYVRLDSKEALLQHGAGVLFRTELLKKFGGYDETLGSAEDYDLLSRILGEGYKGFYLPIPLYRYYIHGENMTLNSDRAAWVEIARKKNET